MASADAVRRTYPRVPLKASVDRCPQTAAAGDQSSGQRLWGQRRDELKDSLEA